MCMNSLMPYPSSDGRLENLLQIGSFFAFVKDFKTFFKLLTIWYFIDSLLINKAFVLNFLIVSMSLEGLEIEWMS
jgi:hypothetical protein